MKKLGLWLLAILGVLALSVGNVSAQALDAGSGTNAINTLAATVTTGSNIMLPIALGLIGLMAGIGLFYRFSGKAKVRS